MSWRRRLVELAAAGGTIALSAGCPPSDACNANPDPCCYAPEGKACADEKVCLAAPTQTCCASLQVLLTCEVPACDPLADNDFDGDGPLEKTGAACGDDPAIGCYPAGSSFTCDTPARGAESLRHGATPLAGDNGCAPGYVVSKFTDAVGTNTYECAALCQPGESYLGNPGPQVPNGVAPHRCSADDAVGAFGTPATATTNGEHCMYVWRFLGLDTTTFLPALDSFGVCVDHTHVRYDADGDGLPDTPWPTCASVPLRDASPHSIDAVRMGCVSQTTVRAPAAR